MAKNEEIHTAEEQEEIFEESGSPSESSSFIEELFHNNQNIIYLVLAGIVVLVGGVFGGKWYLDTQNQEAQVQLFPAVYYLESDSLNKALNGDGNNLGLVEIADQYGWTKAGNLAKFYAGVTFLRTGKVDDAIEYLDGFSSSDLLLQARVYSLLGDAYTEKGDNDEAANYYKKASDYKPNKEFTPIYLMKLGLAYELSQDFASAKETYDRVINDYPESFQANDAKKFKALAEAQISE
jgi:TolA-binding protein